MKIQKPTSKKVPMAKIKELHFGHFFDKGAMRFFNSRLPRFGYNNGNGEIFFITSEAFDSYSPRRYSVRILDVESGRIETLNDFQRFDTKAKALVELRKVLKYTQGGNREKFFN
jgi:hypothetical protein